jgi:hypothetical protein
MSDQKKDEPTNGSEKMRPPIEEHDRFGFRKNFEREEALKDWQRHTDTRQHSQRRPG